MASGCILGDCKICDELIWEDEEIGFDNKGNFYHANCLVKISNINRGDLLKEKDRSLYGLNPECYICKRFQGNTGSCKGRNSRKTNCLAYKSLTTNDPGRPGEHELSK